MSFHYTARRFLFSTFTTYADTEPHICKRHCNTTQHCETQTRSADSSTMQHYCRATHSTAPAPNSTTAVPHKALHHHHTALPQSHTQPLRDFFPEAQLHGCHVPAPQRPVAALEGEPAAQAGPSRPQLLEFIE